MTPKHPGVSAFAKHGTSSRTCRPPPKSTTSPASFLLATPAGGALSGPTPRAGCALTGYQPDDHGADPVRRRPQR